MESFFRRVGVVTDVQSERTGISRNDGDLLIFKMVEL